MSFFKMLINTAENRGLIEFRYRAVLATEAQFFNKVWEWDYTRAYVILFKSTASQCIVHAFITWLFINVYVVLCSVRGMRDKAHELLVFIFNSIEIESIDRIDSARE